MSRKRPYMKTTKKQIVDWCIKNIDECHYPVDHTEMHSHCFRCGYQRATQRAHTVHWSTLDYDLKYDSPEYYRLLCDECHRLAPNCTDEDAMDKWIIESSKEWNPHKFYETYWRNREVFHNVMNKIGTHGFEELNEATCKWATEEMMKDERFFHTMLT